MRMLWWTFLPTQPGASAGTTPSPCFVPQEVCTVAYALASPCLACPPVLLLLLLSGEVAELSGLPFPGSESCGTSV